MAASNATRTITTNPHPLKRDRQKRGKREREGDAEIIFGGNQKFKCH